MDIIPIKIPLKKKKKNRQWSRGHTSRAWGGGAATLPLGPGHTAGIRLLRFPQISRFTILGCSPAACHSPSADAQPHPAQPATSCPGNRRLRPRLCEQQNAAEPSGQVKTAKTRPWETLPPTYSSNQTSVLTLTRSQNQCENKVQKTKYAPCPKFTFLLYVFKVYYFSSVMLFIHVKIKLFHFLSLTKSYHFIKETLFS